MIEIAYTLEEWAAIAVELGRRGRPEIAAPIRATVGAPTLDDQPERFPNPLHLRWYDAAEAREIVVAAARLGIAGGVAAPVAEPSAAVASAEAIVRAHHRRARS